MYPQSSRITVHQNPQQSGSNTTGFHPGEKRLIASMLRHDQDEILKAVSEQFIALRRLCKRQDTTNSALNLLQYFTSHPTHDEACGLTKPSSLFFDFSQRKPDTAFLQKFHDSWQAESAGRGLEGPSAGDVLCKREFTGNVPRYEGTWKLSGWKIKDDDGRTLRVEWVGSNFRDVEQQSKKCWRYRLVVVDEETQQTEEAFPELSNVFVVLVTTFYPSDQTRHRNTQNRKRPRTDGKRPSTNCVKMGPSQEELNEQIGRLEVRQDKLENRHEALNKQMADVTFQLSKLTANEQHENDLMPSHDDPAQAVRTVFEHHRSQWLTKKEVAQALNTGQSLSGPSFKINRILYDLQKEGILERNDQTPPKFRLTAVGSETSLDSPSNQFETGSTGSVLQEADCLNLKFAIRNVFEKDPSPLNKRDVAKVLQTAVEIPVETKRFKFKDINSALYSLEREGVLEKDSQKPPNFRLKSVASESSWHSGTRTWSTDSDPQRGGAAFHCSDQIAASEDLPSSAMPATLVSVHQLDDDGQSSFCQWDDSDLTGSHELFPGVSDPMSPSLAAQGW